MTGSCSLSSARGPAWHRRNVPCSQREPVTHASLKQTDRWRTQTQNMKETGEAARNPQVVPSQAEAEGFSSTSAAWPHVDIKAGPPSKSPSIKRVTSHEREEIRSDALSPHLCGSRPLLLHLAGLWSQTPPLGSTHSFQEGALIYSDSIECDGTRNVLFACKVKVLHKIARQTHLVTAAGKYCHPSII